MKTNLTAQKSNRTFKVWQYEVSHGQLLIRSPKAPATRASPAFLTNVDLVCLGVEYMAVPRVFQGLELVAPSPDEIRQLERLLGRAIAPENLKILSSDGRRFSVVASTFLFSENDWDIFDSPFEFRSQHRREP